MANPQDDASVGELVSRLSEDLSTLVRDEMRLAQAETTAKAKKLGVGAAWFGGTGLLALYGVGALVAAAILGVSEALAPWIAALIVAAALFAIAAVTGLLGKRDVASATPPIPEEAIAGVKADIQTLRHGGDHD